MLKLPGYVCKTTIQDGPHHTLYLGIRKEDQKEVVLKTIHAEHPSLKDMPVLKHEYSVLQKLFTLPGVVHCYGFEEGLKPVLILEALSGQSLGTLLNAGLLPLEKTLKIAINLAETLSALHSKGVMHKDIKPSNIIIEPDTLSVKLIDFGLSSFFLEERSDNLALKEIGGTLNYISPELTGRLNRAIDYRTDFYSLGVTLYQLLTGQLPFQEKEPIEIIYAHLAKTPKPVNEVNAAIPKIVADIIDKLLTKDPEDRYQSAQGIKADLKQCYEMLLQGQAVTTFTLGQHESHEHLQLSKKLYGREEQIKTLPHTFNTLSDNEVHLVLVSGYSGIGKTSLIKELYKPITKRRGLFVSAKFDQIQQAQPYYAFTELLRKVIEHELTHQKPSIP